MNTSTASSSPARRWASATSWSRRVSGPSAARAGRSLMPVARRSERNVVILRPGGRPRRAVVVLRLADLEAQVLLAALPPLPDPPGEAVRTAADGHLPGVVRALGAAFLVDAPEPSRHVRGFTRGHRGSSSPGDAAARRASLVRAGRR